VSGRLQNKEALRRFFPLERWGRKAPWLLTHVVLLALASGILFIPPQGTFILHAWFLVVSVVLYWAISTCIIAFESCRQEIYPYNEERAEVEVLCKLGCIIGLSYAGIPLLILMAQASMVVRLGASALFVVGVLVWALPAAPVWMEANSVNSEDAPEASLCQDFRDTWGNKAFRHLCIVRLCDGLYQGIQATNMLYYMTYILKLKGAERSGFVVILGACGMVGDMSVAVLVGRAMKNRRNSYRLQAGVIWLRTLNVITTLGLLVLPMFLFGTDLHSDAGELHTDRLIFLVWTVVNRVCQSPFSFWRVSAQCWIVDEDIHLGDGTRREAAFIGVASAAQNFARAFAAAVSFMGYGFAGLQPLDCEGECAESLADSCVDLCMERSIEEQPDALRWYIRLLFLIGLLLCEVIMVMNVAAFPIRGIRLARLYNNQTLAQGGKVECGSAERQLGKLQGESSPSIQQIAKTQHAKSVVVMDSNVDSGIAHVQQLMDAQRKSRLATSSRSSSGLKISASVIFGDELEALRVAATPEGGKDGGRSLHQNSLPEAPPPPPDTEALPLPLGLGGILPEAGPEEDEQALSDSMEDFPTGGLVGGSPGSRPGSRTASRAGSLTPRSSRSFAAASDRARIGTGDSVANSSFMNGMSKCCLYLGPFSTRRTSHYHWVD